MLIQITNTCSMGCIHCMQNSSPKIQHMSMSTARKSYEFCKKAGSNAILISGGEPTLHPWFKDIVSYFAEHFVMVIVISNGDFVFDQKRLEAVRFVLQAYNNVYVQVTTHKDYYPKYDEILEKREIFDSLPKCDLDINPTIYIRQLGRALGNKFCAEKALSHPYATSCIMAASYFWQFPFKKTIKIMELRGHSCTPFIDWERNIHLSECWLCPNIGNVFSFDKFDKIIKFKPCGKCKDYKKLLQLPQYDAIKKIMDLKLLLGNKIV